MQPWDGRLRAGVGSRGYAEDRGSERVARPLGEQSNSLDGSVGDVAINGNLFPDA